MQIPLSTFSVSMLIQVACREHLLENARFAGERVRLRFSDRIDAYASWVDVSDEEARLLLAALLEAHFTPAVHGSHAHAAC